MTYGGNLTGGVTNWITAGLGLTKAKNALENLWRSTITRPTDWRRA
jgi:hypothetical protein